MKNKDKKQELIPLPDYRKRLDKWFGEFFEEGFTWQWVPEKQRLRVFNEDKEKVHSFKYPELREHCKLPEDPRLVFNISGHSTLKLYAVFGFVPYATKFPGQLVFAENEDEAYNLVMKHFPEPRGTRATDNEVKVVEYEFVKGLFGEDGDFDKSKGRYYIRKTKQVFTFS